MKHLMVRMSIPFLLFTATVAHAQTFQACGPLENGYGPFDYTNPRHFREFLPRVEAYHFSAEIENLVGRNVVGDIDYTLRAFPNHHRALYSMSRYYLEEVPRGGHRMRYSAECYFDRARRFVPGDAAVVLLEGMYFMKLGKTVEARQRFETALAMEPNSAEIHYNAGLLFADLGEYNRAAEHAKTAYTLGYPLPGLRNKLRKAGVSIDDRGEQE